MNKEVLRAIKFTLFSISAGVIQAIAFTGLLELFHLDSWICNLVALVLSVLWNFTLNRKFTFCSANNIPIAMAQVAAFYVVYTPLSAWTMKVLTGPGIGWNEYLVQGITMVANFVLEYLFQRFVVFRKSIDTAKTK